VRTHDGPGDTVSFHGADPNMRGRWGWCIVQWFFQNSFSRHSLRMGGSHVDHGDTPYNAYSQGGQELNESVRDC